MPRARKTGCSGRRTVFCVDLDKVRLRLRQDILPRLEVTDQGLQVAIAQKPSRKKFFHPRQAAYGFGNQVAGFAHRALSVVSRAAACSAPLGVSSCLM